MRVMTFGLCILASVARRIFFWCWDILRGRYLGYGMHDDLVRPLLLEFLKEKKGSVYSITISSIRLD